MAAESENGKFQETIKKTTKFRQPALELARAAGEQIMECIANPSAPARDKIFQASYVEIGN